MFRNPWIAGLAWLLLGTAADHGVLPALAGMPLWEQWSGARFTALAVILFALLRSTPEALVFALISGAIIGPLYGPGYIGCTMSSFAILSFVAGRMGHWFYLEQAGPRFLGLYLLLLAEGAGWSLIRRIFWPLSPMDVQWLGHLLAAVIGLMIYTLVAPHLKFRPPSLPRIGRKRRIAEDGDRWKADLE